MSIIAAFMVPHPPMIVPQVGRGSEAQIQKTIDAYRQVADEIAALAPETILISSPHATMYADYFHISPGIEAKGSFANFGAGEVNFTERYDTELVGKMELLAQEKDFPAGTLGQRDRALDHGIMVPLYFIRQKYQDFKLVRIGLSGLALTEHYAFGQLIQQAVEETGRRAVYVASGDLSHKLQEYGPYGYAPEGPQYDARIMDVCSRGAFGELFDFEESFCDKAAECGHRSFVIMAGALDGMPVEAKQLSHEDVTGVGYGICTFHVDAFHVDAYRANTCRANTFQINPAKQASTDCIHNPALFANDSERQYDTDMSNLVDISGIADISDMVDMSEAVEEHKVEERRFLKKYLAKKQEELRRRQVQSDAYVKLARKSLESYILTGKRITVTEGLADIAKADKEIAHRQEAGTSVEGKTGKGGLGKETFDNETLTREEFFGKKRPDKEKLGEEELSALTTTRAGAFVSIHEHGKLRGCIGTILPTTSCVAEEIIQNAISASTRDPRFTPITKDELPWLEINVDVLGAPEPIASESMLDVKRYGVIVTSGTKRGLLLPDLDGVDTVEQQLSIAMQKGGIRQGEPVELERFEVIRHV